MPETMTEPRELFLHELGDTLTAERTIEKLLPTLARQAADQELAGELERHLDETRQHVANLEEVFKTLGEPAKGEPCPGIEGLKQEHDLFVSEENTSPEILTMFLTGPPRGRALRDRLLRGLVTMAKALGERKAAQLLQENLRQEKDMLKRVDAVSKRLSREAGKAAAKSSSGSTPRGRAGKGGRSRSRA